MTGRRGSELAAIARHTMGSSAALARACGGVHRRTVFRWISGETPVKGTIRVTLLNIIKHPGEYEHHKEVGK